MTELAVSVEDARMRLGLTQKDLAERLGVSQPHYSKVANETVMHSEKLGERMSAWLDEVGTTPISQTDRRVRQLSRSIREQSRELVSLLAHAGANGSRRPVRRATRTRPGGAELVAPFETTGTEKASE